MSENRDMDHDDLCNATIDLGGRGIHLCFLRRGHAGSHRHSEFLAAVREAEQRGGEYPPKWDGSGVIGDGRGVTGRWVPLGLYQELQAQRDEFAARLADRAAHSAEPPQYALMEATIREQKNVNDDLAFRLGGTQWELDKVRGILRRYWRSVSASEDEAVAQEVVAYLASIPQERAS